MDVSNITRQFYPGALVVEQRFIIYCSVLAWFLLFAVNHTHLAVYLDHGNWTQVTDDGRVHQSGGAAHHHVVFASLGWIVMVVAMMLPTVIPVLGKKDSLHQNDGGYYKGAFALALGYVFVWILFGIVSHILGMFVTAFASHIVILRNQSWIVGVILMLVAGWYQLTQTKSRCLQNCREMFYGGVNLKHRFSRRFGQNMVSLLNGIDYGVCCIKSCWSLMLLMFVFWSDSMVWMLILGIAMNTERLWLEQLIHRVFGWILIVMSISISFFYML